MNSEQLSERTYKYAKSSIMYIKMVNIDYRIQFVSNQFLRSTTSVGANYVEATESQSRRDFIHKVSICKKECKESLYWLKILNSEDRNIDNTLYKDVLEEGESLLKIFAKTVLTAKRNSK